MSTVLPVVLQCGSARGLHRAGHADKPNVKVGIQPIRKGAESGHNLPISLFWAQRRVGLLWPFS